MELTGTDFGQQMIDDIMSSGVSLVVKIRQLAEADSTIAVLYSNRLTQLKPCRPLTIDDLVH